MATNKPIRPIHMFFAVVGLLCGASVLYVNSQPDKVIHVIDSWSKKTRYQVARERLVNVDDEGVLGGFYKCLKNYRPHSTRRISGEPNKKDERLWLTVGESKLIISLNFNETFTFYIETLDEERNTTLSSKSYAINCNIKLLNNK